jgi:hypothetical protein
MRAWTAKETKSKTKPQSKNVLQSVRAGPKKLAAAQRAAGKLDRQVVQLAGSTSIDSFGWFDAWCR